MTKIIQRIFLLFILLNLILPQIVFAAPPVKYNEVFTSPGSGLAGKVFVDSSTIGMTAELTSDNRLKIASIDHKTGVVVKLKWTALNAVNGWSQSSARVQHINDMGVVDSDELVQFGAPDLQEFVYLVVDFSSVIIGGVTGTTTYIGTNVTGNQTITFPFGNVNVSSVDFVITNYMADAYSINGYEWDYLLAYYQNTSVAFADTQHEINNTNFPINTSIFDSIDTDGSGLPIVNFTYSNGSNIPFWAEYWNNASSWKMYTKTSSGAENLTLNFYYGGNSGYSSGSSISDVGEIGSDDFDSGNYDTDSWDLTGSAPSITDGVAHFTVADSKLKSKTFLNTDTDGYIANVNAKFVFTQSFIELADDAHAGRAGFMHWDRQTLTYSDGWGATGLYTANVFHDFEISYNPSGSIIFSVDGSTVNTDSNPSPLDTKLGIGTGALGGSLYINTTFIRKYTTVEPTYIITTQQTVGGNASITASVEGDSNTSTYQAGTTESFTLTPTANISEIQFTSNSTDWSYTATVYWTENANLTESASNGVYEANLTALIPLTPVHGYINYSLTNTTYLNADFSNTPTFTTNDSGYNASLSNLTAPDISIYTSGVNGTYYYSYIANYFYPPSNLISESDIDHIHLNWTATPNADKYSVYELEEGIPWFDTSPTLDGIIDSIYNTTSHQFNILSPNSVYPNDFDLFYMGRDAVWVYLAGTAIDNDASAVDDYARLYIDFTQNGLTADDRMYQIRESGATARYYWSGSSWAISPGSSVGGVTTGAGTDLITYELRVPVSELPASWLTGLETKMLLERECTSLQPDIYSYYPRGNINNTDTSLWQDIKLTNASEYEWIANTTNTEYTPINLSPYNWNQYAISAWNQTNETSYNTIDVTTLDYQTYFISGYILDNSTGLGISNAQVWATNGFVSARETTNTTGYYEHGGFHNGTYIIYADADGYDQNNTTAFTVSGANITNKNIILEVTIVPPPPVTTHLLFPIFLIMVILTLVLTAYSFIIKDPDYYTHIISSTTVSILYFILGYNAYHGIGFTDVVDTATFVNGTITSSVGTVIITTYAYSWLAMLFIIAGAIMALYALVNTIEEGKAIVEDRRNDY